MLDQISAELQMELPGLRGFSSGNLKKMRVFAEFWMNQLDFSSTTSNQLAMSPEEISLALPNQLKNPDAEWVRHCRTKLIKPGQKT